MRSTYHDEVPISTGPGAVYYTHALNIQAYMPAAMDAGVPYIRLPLVRTLCIYLYDCTGAKGNGIYARRAGGHALTPHGTRPVA